MILPNSAPHGLATDGSRPWIIFHSKHDRPSQLPLDCEQCAHDLADIFIHRLSLQPVVSSEQTKRRRLGPPPVTVDTLLWKDVVMVCRHADSCILTSTMKKRGVPMTIISATADPQVALPTRDELIYTTPFAMTGLERKVVVYIPFQSLDPLTSHMQDEEGRELRVKDEEHWEQRNVNVSGDVNVLFSYHEDRAPGTRVQFGHDIGGTGEGLGQLQDATDVQCLPHANILVTDLVNSRLQVYSSEGNPLFSVNPDQIIETVGKCHTRSELTSVCHYLCRKHKDLPVKCDMLLGGGGLTHTVISVEPNDPRVKVFHGGSWGYICANNWDSLDAHVICRMLGYWHGRGTADLRALDSGQTIWLSNMMCTGSESDISECRFQGVSVDELTMNRSCGALYATETGTVESEDYPLSYPRNLNCLYVIRPANDQLLYKLEFNSTFSTEECCDKLEVNVLSGKSNVPTGGVTYAGDVGPTRLLGKAFALNFVTDGSNSGEGFQAHWSPASVQDVAIIQCGSGHFTVSIDLNFLQRLYPASTQSTISLADPACTGSVTSINGSDSLVITSETDACGTKIVATPTEIEYSNFLVDRVFAESSSVIVRDRRWEIPIHCSVARTDKFEVHYNPFPDVGKRHLPQQDESSAHGRTRREVRGQISKSLDFPITMTGYQDKTFSALASVPLHRRLKEEIDLRVQLEGGDSDLKLVLQNCYTRPLPTSDVTYTIIKSGCAVDANTEIIDTQPHNTDFRFTAFEFAGDYPHVYLECDADGVTGEILISLKKQTMTLWRP
nr:hypothetical protein BaRGS_017361 [Batillaria attramentaria]